MIQAYNFYTTSYTSNMILRGGYINILGHNSNGGWHLSHDQISTRHGYENLPNLSVMSSYSFSSTDGYELSDETLTNYSMNVESTSEFSLNEASYTLEIHTVDSYVISLPENLNQTLLVNPGQNLTIDLP